MKGRKTRGSTTITLPEYGDVEWLDTSKARGEIRIRYWSAKHGEHLEEWVDWTLPKKKES
jgi:hypothetical protein